MSPVGAIYVIPYIVGKLAPNSSHLTRGLVKYVPGRGYFRAVSSHNGDTFVTSPHPPIVEGSNRAVEERIFCILNSRLDKWH